MLNYLIGLSLGHFEGTSPDPKTNYMLIFNISLNRVYEDLNYCLEWRRDDNWVHRTDFYKFSSNFMFLMVFSLFWNAVLITSIIPLGKTFGSTPVFLIFSIRPIFRGFLNLGFRKPFGSTQVFLFFSIRPIFRGFLNLGFMTNFVKKWNNFWTTRPILDLKVSFVRAHQVLKFCHMG